MSLSVDIYTDGSCSGNPGVGGWGALLLFRDKRKEISGYSMGTTNNRMELTAAIEGINVLTKSCLVNLYTDSKYLQKGITEWINRWQLNGWRKSDNSLVKNVELWKKLHMQTQKHDIIWHWIKGHGDNYGNNVADSLAVAARNKARSAICCA